MRSLTAALLAGLLAAAVVGAVGCGGGQRKGQVRPASDEEQVRATVLAFARASAARDYPRLCGQVLSTRLVDRIQRSGVTCAEVMAQLLQGVRDPTIQIQAIRVDHGTARARVRSVAAGQPASEDTLELVHEPVGWRIAALGRAG